MLKLISQPNIQLYRKVVQYIFLVTVVLIGIQFSIFVNQLANGMSPTVTRPPGIEAFLPISSLISLKYLLVTGIFNHVHPSGLIIFSNVETCTNCQKCTHTCPADIRIHETSCVRSDECHACLKCVAVCPEKDTLYISALKRKAILKPWVYAAAICLLFIGGPLAARITGNWQTRISSHEYLFHVRNLSMPFYQHNRGQVPAYDKEAWLRMIEQIRQAGEKRNQS